MPDVKKDFVLEEIRELRKDFKAMNATLVVNTESLRIHIRRTELLEQATINLDGRLTELEIKKIEKDAVKRWVISTAILSGKVMAGVGAVIGAIAGLPIVAQWLVRILTP